MGFRESFGEAAQLLDQFRADAATLETLEAIAACLAKCFRSGGKALVCGNGGSLADAAHFAEEWTGRFRQDRRPYPVMALTDAAHLSCVANDFGFEEVFARSVTAFGKPGDILFLLSTSGNSPNLLRAAEAAARNDMVIVGMLGRDGGSVLPHCHFAVIAPGQTSDRIQELHMLALHTLIEVVEADLAQG